MNCVIRSISFIAAVLLLATFANKAAAQATVNGTRVGAVILTPIAVSQVKPLHFGAMAVLESTPGTVILSTDGSRTSTEGVNLSALAPVATPATYTVTGEPSYTYAITLPSSIIVTHSTNTNTMVINNLLAKSTSGVEAHNAIGTLTALEGSESFTVGGTLNVLAGQGPGNYSGDFNITVVYN